jgi:hypothetical protein
MLLNFRLSQMHVDLPESINRDAYGQNLASTYQSLLIV